MSLGQRRLAAIMFTDIVGYTSLMQKDESLAMELLEEHRRVVRQTFAKHGGREVKTMGDAFLLEFPGALEAVRCASEVQGSLHDRNAGCEPKRRVVIRAGVHLGEVIQTEDGNDIYGNSVNIASRIEPLADPGGICVTEQVYAVAKSSPDLRFEDLGEHDLKNVEVPVGIYRVILPWEPQDRRAEAARRGLAELQPVQFVDRDAERAKIENVLDAVAAGSPAPRVVLIGGEAGVGKTRLVDWVIREAMLRGAEVARGYCQSDVSVAYFPVSEAFGRYLSSRRGDTQAGSVDLLNWVRTSTKAAFGYDPGSGPSQLYEGTVRLLERLSGRNAFLLCIEDLQWADSATLSLLHYIGRNTAAGKVLVVCTYRPEDLARTTGGPHPLLETISLLSRESLCLSMELGRMDPANIREIVAPMLGGAGGEYLERVSEESGGNPLYAVEYARLMKGGTPGPGAEKGPGPGQMPGAVQGVILRRIGRLGPEERRLINCAALIGEKFDPQVLTDALGLERLLAIERLDSISRTTRILREEVEGRTVASFRFDHAKIREVVVGELSRGLKAELHARIAEALRNSQSGAVEEIAFHYREANEPAKVHGFAMAAGDRARLRYANTEAVGYYGWAVEALESTGGEQKDAISRALIGRASSYLLLGKNEQALGDAQRVLKEAVEPSLRLQAIHVCADSSFDLGRFTQSLEYCESAESEGTGTENIPERLRIGRTKAAIVGYRGDPAAALAELERVVRGFREVGDKRETAETLLALREFQLTLSDVAGATRSAEEARSVFRELGDLEGEMRSSHSLASASLFRGDIEGAAKNYARAAELGEKLGLYGSLNWIYLYWGLAHESAEEYDTALNLSLKALDSARLSETPYAETAVWTSLTRLYTRTNKDAEAQNADSTMDRLFNEYSRDASLTLQATVKRSRGFYRATHGEPELADLEYLSSIELLQTGPLGPYHESETRTEYAELLLAQGRRAEADAQLGKALGIYEKFGNGPGISRVQRMRQSAAG